MKACADCKHLVVWLSTPSSMCRKAAEVSGDINFVTGDPAINPRIHSCQQTRESHSACTPDALWFEPTVVDSPIKWRFWKK